MLPVCQALDFLYDLRVIFFVNWETVQGIVYPFLSDLERDVI